MTLNSPTALLANKLTCIAFNTTNFDGLLLGKRYTKRFNYKQINSPQIDIEEPNIFVSSACQVNSTQSNQTVFCVYSHSSW